MENLEYKEKCPSDNNIPQHNIFSFHEQKEGIITFNSCFDSGNMNRVIRQSYDQYHIWTANDAQGTDN